MLKVPLRNYQVKEPLVAAMEGPCIVGGTEILQATDVRVAGEGATLGISEVRWSLFPMGGSTVRLRRQTRKRRRTKPGPRLWAGAAWVCARIPKHARQSICRR